MPDIPAHWPALPAGLTYGRHRNATRGGIWHVWRPVATPQPGARHETLCGAVMTEPPRGPDERAPYSTLCTTCARRLADRERPPAPPDSPFWRALSYNHPTAHHWTAAGRGNYRSACGIKSHKTPFGKADLRHCDRCSAAITNEETMEITDMIRTFSDAVRVLVAHGHGEPKSIGGKLWMVGAQTLDKGGVIALARELAERETALSREATPGPTTDAAIVDVLTTDESAALATHEDTIARGLSTFIEVGEALAEIRDQRLYRATHASFADYLAERWPQIGSRRQADRLISAAEVEHDLRPIGLSLASESQARVLAPLSPDERRAAMQAATEAAAGQAPTAKQIERAAGALRPPILRITDADDTLFSRAEASHSVGDGYLNRGKMRRPFEYDGKLWISVGGTYGGGYANYDECACVRVVLEGEPYVPGEPNNAFMPGGYTHDRASYGGKNYVLTGQWLIVRRPKQAPAPRVCATCGAPAGAGGSALIDGAWYCPSHASIAMAALNERAAAERRESGALPADFADVQARFAALGWRLDAQSNGMFGMWPPGKSVGISTPNWQNVLDRLAAAEQLANLAPAPALPAAPAGWAIWRNDNDTTIGMRHASGYKIGGSDAAALIREAESLARPLAELADHGWRVTYDPACPVDLHAFVAIHDDHDAIAAHDLPRLACLAWRARLYEDDLPDVPDDVIDALYLAGCDWQSITGDWVRGAERISSLTPLNELRYLAGLDTPPAPVCETCGKPATTRRQIGGMLANWCVACASHAELRAARERREAAAPLPVAFTPDSLDPLGIWQDFAQLLSDHPAALLTAARAALDALVDSDAISTDVYDNLAARIGRAQRALAESEVGA